MAGGRASVAAPQPTARAAGCEYCRRCMGATIREWQPGPDGYRLRKLGHRFRRNSQWFQPVTIQQTGHCYITGNTVHGSSSTQSGLWAIIVADANHYQRITLISGGYTPSVGDETFLGTTIRPSTDRRMPTSSLACSRTTSTPSAPRCSQPTPARSANSTGPTTSLRNVLLLTGRPIPAGRAPQSGRQSPSQYLTQSGSGLDRLKMEALSWGSTYRNFTNAQAAIAFPVTAPGSWAVTAAAYLVPWFNGGCPWTMEYVRAVSQSIPLILFWALDHLCPFSWRLPLPNETDRVVYQ